MVKYIKEIEIEELWGIYNFRWEVSSGVNILAGGNGSGKSTVLHCLGDMFREGCLSAKRKYLVSKVTVTFDDGSKVDSLTKFDPTPYQIVFVSTFDMAMKEGDAVRKLSGSEIVTELDWELYKLNSAYLDYQLEISKEVIEALSAGQSTCEILAHKENFHNIIDTLFAPTKKKIDRTNNSLGFTIGGHKISPYQLSSGEKQILVILTSALVCNRRPAMMIMDEPEISLHLDWQRRMISDILQLNPKMQLIIATHSPAVVMSGWIDRVQEMSELLSQLTISGH